MEDRSLSEVNASVEVPKGRGFLRRLLAFSGPAYLVAVGYMDPGNWATDIAAGSRYGYGLLWVLLASNAIALVLQGFASRLGLVSGRDLAQSCRDRYPTVVNFTLWLMAEVAVAATDLAEVVGSAIGLQLLFGLPLAWGIGLTALDTFLILVLHQAGIRKMEAFILVLVGTIGASLLAELLMVAPDLGAVASGFAPSLPDGEALYFAIGILGATVMPHNLYLHSALVQSRNVVRTKGGILESLRFNRVDSVVALNLAFLINAAILVLAASAFHTAGLFEVADIREAHRLLEPIVGTSLAPVLFAVALIASGQSSTVTGTLAGQIVMEGYVNLRLRPWIRRVITRALAIGPAIAVVLVAGERETGALLVLSQVILSLQLPFAVIPLLHMVGDAKRMGAFAVRGVPQAAGWAAALAIVALNAWLVARELSAWVSAPGVSGTVAWAVAVPLVLFVSGLLAYVTFEPWLSRTRMGRRLRGVHAPGRVEEVAPAPAFRRVAAALDFGPRDRDVLARAAAMASCNQAPLHLFHVVESAAARALGREVEDAESVEDRARLERYAVDLGKYAIDVVVDLGFGEPARVLPELVRRHGADLLVLGAHGHRGVGDWIHGSTIDEVRHRLDDVAILVVGK